MRYAARALAAALVLLLTTGCAFAPLVFLVHPEDVREQVAQETGSRFEHQTLTWHPCYGDADLDDAVRWGGDRRWLEALECATMLAPLDHADPGGRTLRIAVIRAPATGGPEERLGSLVINVGGPGGDGVDALYYETLSDEVRAGFDLVSFDPRGVGVSHGVLCGDWEGIERAHAGFGDTGPADLTPEQLGPMRDAARAFADDCVEQEGEEFLAGMGTVNVVRDLELLRQAVGDPALTYLGYSYGTHIGALYAEMYPATTRALVLDGAVETERSNAESAYEQSVGFQTSWGYFVDDCVANADQCPFGSAGAAEEEMADILDGLDRDPTRVGEHEVDSGFLMDMVATALYDEFHWEYLDDVLSELAEGDRHGTERWLPYLYDNTLGYHDGEEGQDELVRADVAAMTAVNCADRDDPRDVEAYREAAEREARDAPLFAGGVWAQLPCAYWPGTEEAPTGFTAPDAPPIVVIGTVGDPATPYTWAQELSAQLDTATLLTYEGAGHTVYGFGVNDCVDSAVDAYLLGGPAPGSGHFCFPE